MKLLYALLKTASFYLLSFAISLWVLGSFFYLSMMPTWLQILMTLLVFAGLILTFIKFNKKIFSCTLASIFLIVILLFYLDPPTNNRLWAPDQEFFPIIKSANKMITIKNFRNFKYRSNTDFDIHWETRTFNLDNLIRVDFIIEPFSNWRGLAHTFLTFSFSDGEHISISVEIRKEQKEQYSVLAGFYRNYELIYIIGDERDLIGLRANIRKDPVYLFPIKAKKDQVKRLFMSMLERANDLAEHPEYYNTLFNTCSTNITKHLYENFKLDFGFDYRILFPGYADELAFELDLIDTNKSLEEARNTFLINKRSQFIDDGKKWSKQIRTTTINPIKN
ncbi:MAG: hypothetical protein COA79_23700 [Planctomycetota bacterium]|nr:MAG: hypothetical protein COA79_23700 [Planctomycetota bacterium]